MLLAIWLSFSASAVARLPEAVLAYMPWLSSRVMPFLAHFMSWTFPFIFLVFVYHVMPKRRVGWLEALISALVATALWRAVTAAWSGILAAGYHAIS